MDILPSNEIKRLDKNTIEQVENKQAEYSLLGSIVRRRGQSLFSYNPESESIEKVEILDNSVVTLEGNPSDRNVKAIASGKAKISTSNYYFECLNMKNAMRRVDRWKKGQIKNLINLRVLHK